MAAGEGWGRGVLVLREGLGLGVGGWRQFGGGFGAGRRGRRRRGGRRRGAVGVAGARARREGSRQAAQGAWEGGVWRGGGGAPAPGAGGGWGVVGCGSHTRDFRRVFFTARSMRRKKLRNSLARWRGMHSPMTRPDLTSSAAKSVGGAMALVVVGHRGRPPLLERQTRLCPIERLDLGLLIDAEHHGPIRRIEIEANDLGDLLLEHRVVSRP